MITTLIATTLAMYTHKIAAAPDNQTSHTSESTQSFSDTDLACDVVPSLGQFAPFDPCGSFSRYRGALAFDGVDDLATVPPCTATRYPGHGGWTVELWVIPIVYPFKGEASIVGQESVGVDAHDPWSIRIHPTHFEWRIDDDQGRSASLQFDMALGVWQHLACVYDDSNGTRNLRVCINGKLLGEREIEIAMESRLDPVYMGALWKHRFRGLIDDVRVWSTARSENAINEAMYGGWNPFLDPSNSDLRAWWAFDEKSGAVAVDWSWSKAHAVLGKPHEPDNTTAPTKVTREPVNTQLQRDD